MARPTKYSAKIGDAICARVAEGESIKRICEGEEMPCKATVYNWLFDSERKEFLDNYEKARQIQAETLADEITDIADDSTNDYMIKKYGDDEREVINSENIQRSRLRVDARKWVASKLLPKKYGDKIETTHKGTMKVVMTEDDANL
jgi:hypothetical protein